MQVTIVILSSRSQDLIHITVVSPLTGYLARVGTKERWAGGSRGWLWGHSGWSGNALAGLATPLAQPQPLPGLQQHRFATLPSKRHLSSVCLPSNISECLSREIYRKKKNSRKRKKKEGRKEREGKGRRKGKEGRGEEGKEREGRERRAEKRKRRRKVLCVFTVGPVFCRQNMLSLHCRDCHAQHILSDFFF